MCVGSRVEEVPPLSKREPQGTRLPEQHPPEVACHVSKPSKRHSGQGLTRSRYYRFSGRRSTQRWFLSLHAPAAPTQPQLSEKTFAEAHQRIREGDGARVPDAVATQLEFLQDRVPEETRGYSSRT